MIYYLAKGFLVLFITSVGVAFNNSAIKEDKIETNIAFAIYVILFITIILF